MKSVFNILVISLSILAVAKGLSIAECNRMCTMIYRPVCAALKMGSTISICTFGNKCMLGNAMCRQMQTWTIIDANKKCKRDSDNCRELLK